MLLLGHALVGPVSLTVLCLRDPAMLCVAADARAHVFAECPTV